MAKEVYVSFETAKLLKDAGFPQKRGFTYAVYLPWKKEGDRLYCFQSWAAADGIFHKEKPINAPTQAVAMRWLREEKMIGVEILESINGLSGVWDGGAYDRKTGETITHTDYQPSYEVVAECGIQDACRHLIQLKQG